jgi:predicted PurR-regulated permease PerM
MKVKIEIDTKTFIRFWLVVIGFILAGLVIYSARTALVVIGMAFFLALILSPSVNLLARVLPNKNRVLSTAIAYIAVVLFLGVVIFLVVPPIVNQTIKFAQNVPNLVDNATQQSSGITKLIKQNNLQPEVDQVFNSLRSSTTHFVSGVGSSLVSSIASVLSIITATILVIVLTFLMLVEGPTWVNRLWGLYKDKERMKRHRAILGKMYNVINNYAIGQLSVSAIDGFISGLAVFILSMIFTVPAGLAITTAVVMFLASMVPLFGAMIGAIFISLILALNNITAAIIFLIFFVVYQQIENNLVSPKIQSKRNDLSTLTILVSVTIGIYLFGIIGGIISIPIAGCIKVLVDNRLSKNKKVKPKE